MTRSHARPKVSHDNPYSEAQFKTTKYMSDYPDRFDSLAHVREWFDAFIAYCNHEHRHSGIGWHTRPPPTSGPPKRSATNEPPSSPRPTPVTPDHPDIPEKSWINDLAKFREPAPQTS